MIEPTEQDIGRKVIYRDLGGWGKIEEGLITSFNEHWVFVRYHGITSAATARSDLEWSNRRPEETAIASTMRRGKTIQIDFCEPPRRPYDPA